MCQYHSLYSGEQGYVVRCAQCGQYQWAFGTTLQQSSPTAFVRLRKEVMYLIDQIQSDTCRRKKQFLVHIGHTTTRLILTAPEVEKFYAMLSEAWEAETTKALFSLFENSDHLPNSPSI